MRIAFIGDIVGSHGRDMLKAHLKKIRQEHAIDFVVANYENASHGFGLTVKNANEIVGYGVDCMSGGNHTWDKKDVEEINKKYLKSIKIHYVKTMSEVVELAIEK